MTRDELLELAREPNVAAFLRVVRAGESGQSDTAYRTLYGGQLFDDLAQHPRRAIRSPWGWTSAAGAYQIVATVPGRCKVDTWDWLVQRCKFADFSPATQDAAAVALIIRRGALDAVRAGHLEQAIALCNREWASLPGAPYGQPALTMARCLEVYRIFGGRLAGEPAPAPAPPAEVPVKPAPTMPADRPGAIEIVTSVWRALRAGAKLANSKAWKDRTMATNSVAAVLAGVVTVAKGFGYELPLSDSDLVVLAGAVGVLLGVFNTGSVAVTTADAGLLPARRPGAADGPGPGDTGGGP